MLVGSQLMWITINLGIIVSSIIIIRCIAPSASSISFFSVEISRRLVIVGYLDKRQQHLIGFLGDAIDSGEIGWAGEDAAFLPETDDASGLPAF